MKEREIAEIRRTLSPERSTARCIFGAYVNATGQIIDTFEASMLLLGEDAAEHYFSLFKRVLSGTLDKNLLDIPFSTAKVESGAAHRRLQLLRAEEADPKELSSLFAAIADGYKSEDNFVILLLRGVYDVVKRGRQDDEGEERTELYTHILCAICPVKPGKSALTYAPDAHSFIHQGGQSTIGAPEAGFLFPAFDERSTNIYNALFYTKNTAKAHEELTAALFDYTLPMPAAQQEKTFRSVLAEALGEDCTLPVLRAVHEDVREKITVHKETKCPEPLKLTEGDLTGILSAAGLPEERIEAFSEKFRAGFGPGAQLPPKNIVNPRRFELKTAKVHVKVDPTCEGMVTTKTIEGKPYLLIPLEEGVEVNGVDIKIKT